jgi:hypothetical protein
MIRIRSHVSVVLTVLAIVGIGRVVRAQDDVVVEEERAAPDNVVVQIPRGPASVVLPVPRVELVDRWLFGGQRGAVNNARKKLDWALGMRIDEIERSCELTEAQKRKLQLAGTADIKRFFDRVDEIKRQLKDINNVQNNVIQRVLQPVAGELQSGLFGDHSFFAKTIKRTLSAEQSAQLEIVIHQQKLSRYRTTVGWYVVHLNKSLGLSDDQRQRLVELLVNETRPPKKYGQGMNWYVLLQTSTIPESKFKPILDDIQWKIFRRQFIQAKTMGPWLELNGIVADDEPGGGQPALATTPAIPAGSTRTIKRGEVEAKPSEKKRD